MLKMEPKPDKYNGMTMKEKFMEDGSFTTKAKITSAIELVKTLPIDGCITGSCLLPDFDPDGWGTTPDVDVFVFGESELVSAIELARHALKMEPGSGTERSRKQEEWKLSRLKQAGLNHKIGITTYKFWCDGVILNFTFKQRQFYWNLPMEYTFDKSRNGLVRLEFGAGDRISNGLVAQHILDLEHITEWTGSERIDEFKDSYTKAHVQYNFSDYFGMKVGMVFHRRSAVAKGVYRQRGLLTDYRSFSPLLELQYRPLGMNGPVITADYERGIKGVFKSDNNYERWEFDLSYIHPMPCMRYLSMRAGGGFYSTAIDTYNFVDYSNFRENNIPGGWNDDWSGDFELLSRKWYNTSKYYLRANVTYESPLLAISWIPFIGHFIEKERVYLGLLKTENLKHYEEIGYGFTNRIFSIVAFMALRDGRYDGFGMKFGFELFSNW